MSLEVKKPRQMKVIRQALFLVLSNLAIKAKKGKYDVLFLIFFKKGHNFPGAKNETLEVSRLCFLVSKNPLKRHKKCRVLDLSSSNSSLEIPG
jgi:hypothetical protein